MLAAPSDASIRLRSAVRSLTPQLQTATPATDRDRRLPDAVVLALRDAGVYRMVVPVELGGDGVDLATYLDVLETVAEGNGAASWDLATSCWHTMNALTLSSEGIERIFGDSPDVIIAGGISDIGDAVEMEGGFRVTGRWRFGSGCAEAGWMAGGFQVCDDGAPRLGENGQPLRYWAFFPRWDVTIHDTWRVVGMRGTGSHDWSVADVAVPASLTQVVPAPRRWSGGLYSLFLPFTALQFSAVATGLARRAVDGLIDLATIKTPSGARALLRERVQVQEAVGKADALLESARAYRAAIVSDIWSTTESGEALSARQRARVRLAGTHVTECAVRAVDLMFGAGGTTSIEDESPLSHCFRDVHVVAQNINVLPIFYEHGGRVLLGMESGTPFI